MARSDGRRRGRDRELRYAEWLEATYGGLARRFESGCFDIVWLRERTVCKLTGAHATVLIQVKSTAAGAFAEFGPARRAEALAQARQANVDLAVLVWWPPGIGQPEAAKWIPAHEWPESRRRDPGVEEGVRVAA